MVDDYTKQLEQQLEELKDKLAAAERRESDIDNELRYVRDENDQLKDMVQKMKHDNEQMRHQSGAICKAAAMQGLDINYADEVRKMLEHQRQMTAYYPDIK